MQQQNAAAECSSRMQQQNAAAECSSRMPPSSSTERVLLESDFNNTIPSNMKQPRLRGEGTYFVHAISKIVDCKPLNPNWTGGLNQWV